MSVVSDIDQGETVIIRHGLRRGSLPDETKRSLPHALCAEEQT